MRLSLPILLVAGLLHPEPVSSQPQARGQPNEAVAVAQRLVHALDLKFETGRRVVQPTSLATLDAVADVLRRLPSVGLEVAGHTDASGSAEANLRLSRERARSVADYLIARHGINPERLDVTGYGDSFPIASNATAAGRALNRRVSFRLLEDRDPPAAVAERVSPQPLDGDSLREDIERQVAEAARLALGDAGENDADLEARLQERIDRIEAQLDAELPAETVLPLYAEDRRVGVLPFAGVYLGSGMPILTGLRLDFATSFLGSARFQPEAAVGFLPNDQIYSVGANLVFPSAIRTLPDVLPFLGLGVAFHNVDGLESSLNLFIGAEYRFTFGVLFGDLMTQDFFDHNRVVVGFRQDF